MNLGKRRESKHNQESRGEACVPDMTQMAKRILVFIVLYDMSKHGVNQGESESCESQQSSTFQSQVLPRRKIAGRSRTKNASLDFTRMRLINT